MGDLSERNRMGLPDVKVSVPAIMLQIAAEKLFGQFDKLDRLTVSLAQPDGAIALLAGSGSADSYAVAPPFTLPGKDKPNIHQVRARNQECGTPAAALV